jgi:hypothetical protein
VRRIVLLSLGKYKPSRSRLTSGSMREWDM